MKKCVFKFYRKKVGDELELVCDGLVGLDQVEKQGRGHDGATVHHGVVRLPYTVHISFCNAIKSIVQK